MAQSCAAQAGPWSAIRVALGKKRYGTIEEKNALAKLENIGQRSWLKWGRSDADDMGLERTLGYETGTNLDYVNWRHLSGVSLPAQ